MRRDLKRAVLRGALPSLIGLLLLPFEPKAAPGVVFFALVATALSLLDDLALGSLPDLGRAGALAGWPESDAP